MKENTGSFDSKALLVGKWLLVTMLGWALSLLAIGGTNIHSWSEWRALVVSYALNGALIGTIIGLGQALILSSWQVPRLKWVLTTLAAYAIGLPTGVVLALIFALRTWPAEIPMLTGISTTFVQIDLFTVAVVPGIALGLGQWWMLKNRVIPSTRRRSLLWMLGNISGFGIGGFLAKVLSDLTRLGYFSEPIGHLAERIAVGAIFGLITGTILVILHQSGSQQSFTPS